MGKVGEIDERVWVNEVDLADPHVYERRMGAYWDPYAPANEHLTSNLGIQEIRVSILS
jgi:hypothetical protein